MTSSEFLLELLDNYWNYIISLIICSVIFYFLFRNKVRSITDPLLVSIISAVLADSIVVYLSISNLMPKQHTIFFLIGQTLFFAIYQYYIPSRSEIVVDEELVESEREDYLLFEICILIYLFCTLYSWYLNGVPIFNSSRFEINIDNSSGILGLLSKISNAVLLYLVIYSFHITNSEQYIKGYVYLLIISLLCLLGGSKGFILTIVSGYFFYYCFYINKFPKIQFKYIAIIIATPLLAISIAGIAGENSSALLVYLYRLLAYGDIYWYAYPDDAISSITIQAPFLNMSSLLLGPFRHIFDFGLTDDVMQTAGGILFEQIYDYFPEKGAPNSPVFITSWVYFRWYGLFMTLLIAWIGSLFYNRLHPMERSLPNCCIRGLMINVSLCWNDIYLFFYYIWSVIIFTFIFIGVKYINSYFENKEQTFKTCA